MYFLSPYKSYMKYLPLRFIGYVGIIHILNSETIKTVTVNREFFFSTDLSQSWSKSSWRVPVRRPDRGPGQRTQGALWLERCLPWSLMRPPLPWAPHAPQPWGPCCWGAHPWGLMECRGHGVWLLGPGWRGSGSVKCVSTSSVSLSRR